MKLNKEACIVLAIKYIRNTNKYPSSKKWTIKSAGCSRDRIYENWGTWSAFISEVSKVINIPDKSTTGKKRYLDSDLLNTISCSAQKNNNYPKYSDFCGNVDNPSAYTLRTRLGSWEHICNANGYHKTYVHSETANALTLIDALTLCYNLGNYHIPNTYSISKEELLVFIAERVSTRTGALGLSSNRWSIFIKTVFPDKKNNKRLYTYLLSTQNLKLCTKCNRVYCVTYFKHSNYCKKCSYEYNASYTRDYTALRRALKNNATPTWVNRQDIKNIYNNCPKGYHVDHIIPLKSEYVCGLHVPWNLQYLLAADNISKSNTFNIWW